MAGKMKISFYEFMQRYPHQDQGRRALAYDLKAAADKDSTVRSIDSLIDMMVVVEKKIKDPSAAAAATGDLWSEYCAMCDHPC